MNYRSRFFFVVLCVLAIAFIFPISSYGSHVFDELQEDPPAYAKWGKIAVQEVKARYPEDKVVDYFHVGRKTEGQETIETFKLWLEGDTKEFGVIIDIHFNTDSEEITDLQFKETSR